MVDLGIEGIGPARAIGGGGSATVFSATRASIGDTVAIKVLKTTLIDDQDQLQFERELSVLAKLRDCPGVVAILGSGVTDRSEPYLILPYFGRSAHDLMLQTGGVDWRLAARIVADASRSVHQAHERGIFHCDLKPANLLVNDSHEVFVADFGIAWLTGDSSSIANFAGFSPEYAPPEVIDGGAERTAAADVYSLAATFVALVTGRPPFHIGEGDSALSIVRRIEKEPPPSLRAFGVPEQVAEVMGRALAKAPMRRQSSADQFAKEITAAVATIAAEPPPTTGASAPPTVPIPEWAPPVDIGGPGPQERTGGGWRVGAVIGVLFLALVVVIAIAAAGTPSTESAVATATQVPTIATGQTSDVAASAIAEPAVSSSTKEPEADVVISTPTAPQATAPAPTATTEPVATVAPTPRPTAKPTVQPTPEPYRTTTVDRKRGCEPGYRVMFSGAALDGGFDLSGGEYSGVTVSICRNESGDLHYFGADLESGESIVLPACQQAPEIWVARNKGWTYTVVDERNSARDVPGVLSLRSPEEDIIQFNLWDDAIRATSLQEQHDNNPC